MPVTQHIVNTINKNSEVIQKTLSPHAETLRFITIGTAAALILAYVAFQKFNKPSKSLMHLPYISFFSFIKYAVIKDALFETYSNELVMPLFKNGNNGVYVRPSVTGWYIETVNPIAVKELLLKQESLFPKMKIDLGTENALIPRFIGGPSIVFLSGDDWKRHRKIANPAFQKSMPVTTFGKLTKKMFDVIDSTDNTVNVFNIFERLALDAIGIAGFDFDFNALSDKNSKWVHYYDSIKSGMGDAFFLFFPIFDTKYLDLFKKRKQIHDNLSEFLQNLDNIIESRRQAISENTHTSGPEGEKDLLTLMIESEMRQDGTVLSNEELRSNLCIFFLAGHDTTANALACTLYELAQNPEIQEKARQEAIRILGESPEDIIPSVEQIREIKYINMVIKEVLRRHPPAYHMTGRLCQQDINLAGHFIPKGTQVAVDIYNLHHNPAVWKDPYVFDPERFAPGGEADSKRGIAWVPFSNGSRQCIGMNFSMAEQRVVLLMILRKYKWSLPANSPHKERLQKKGIAWGLMINKNPLDIIFEKRY